MISIGVRVGGPELKDSPIDKVLTRSASVAMTRRDADFKDRDEGWINPIFVIPGSVSKPNFKGFCLGHFSKREKGLVVQIEVPQQVADGDGINEFVGQSLREAVQLAAVHFASKGISFSVLRAEILIMAIEADLKMGTGTHQ